MKLAILDRDGVINQDSPAFIKSPQEWILLPGSAAAIARLNRAGWRVAVATNQSGLARGLFDQATLARIHEQMERELAVFGAHIDAIAVCPHGPADQCACRKPQPGLLKQLAAQFGVNLRGVPVIGDALRDIQAAQAVGAWPILVHTGQGALTAARAAASLSGVTQVADLAAAVDLLLD